MSQPHIPPLHLIDKVDMVLLANMHILSGTWVFGINVRNLLVCKEIKQYNYLLKFNRDHFFTSW